MVAVSSKSSLSIQRQLSKATDQVARSYTRLSSGLRINRSVDDAAGLAVSESLNLHSRLYNKASRNINDGISALTIATSALESQNEIVIRLRELAEQSANGTYSSEQRRALNTEYKSLLREFGRIGETASFNGLNLLMAGRGSNVSVINLQAGIDGASNSSITTSLTDSGPLSGTVNPAASEPTAFLPQGFTIDELSAFGSLYRGTVSDSTGAQRDILVVIQADSASAVFDVFIRAEDSNGLESTTASNWVNSGLNSSIAINTNTGRLNSSILSGPISNLIGGANAQLNLDVSGLKFSSSLLDYTTSYNNIDLTGIETKSMAQSSMGILAQRQTDISSTIGQFGATQSRLAVANNVINAQAESTLAASASISDADIAEESAKLIAAQINQQSATNILKMSNNQQKLILSLLR